MFLIFNVTSLFRLKSVAFTRMTLRTLVKRIYGEKLPVSVRCHNLHFYREEKIILCPSILETRRISHLFSSALFTVDKSNNYLSCFCEPSISDFKKLVLTSGDKFDKKRKVWNFLEWESLRDNFSPNLVEIQVLGATKSLYLWWIQTFLKCWI